MTSEEVFSLKGHALPVLSIAFSEDGQRLASASFDKEIKVWDMSTGREVLQLSGHPGVIVSVSFSPDGHRLVSASADGTIKVWNATPRQ